jgi:hypothetical protein
MLPLSMTSRTVDPPEPSLTPTDAGTQETTPAPPSQSSREPSLFSRLSSRFNKTQKITVEPKKITIESIKASYVATKDKEKPAIGTAVGKKFLKTFDHLIDQNPEWFSGIFLKLFSHSDQQQAVISSHTKGKTVICTGKGMRFLSKAGSRRALEMRIPSSKSEGTITTN